MYGTLLPGYEPPSPPEQCRVCSAVAQAVVGSFPFTAFVVPIRAHTRPETEAHQRGSPGRVTRIRKQVVEAGTAERRGSRQALGGSWSAL